nr:GNAT family N-acetyltransferase [Betaproteobacteria bacterium]
MKKSSVSLQSATDRVDLEQVRALFLEYAASLQIDLGFQGFEQELLELPGEYALHRGGALLLARVDGQAAGCGAMRAFPDADYSNACEMKRVYVRPAFRSIGLGLHLAGEFVDIPLREREDLADRAAGQDFLNIVS